MSKLKIHYLTRKIRIIAKCIYINIGYLINEGLCTEKVDSNFLKMKFNFKNLFHKFN